MTQNPTQTRESWRDYFLRLAASDVGSMVAKGEDARWLGDSLYLDYTRRAGFRLFLGNRDRAYRLTRDAAIMLLAGNLALEEAWRHAKTE